MSNGLAAGPSALVLVLHAHLPLTRPCSLSEDVVEADWFFEAVIECYLPLHAVLRSWADDGVPASVVISLSPTLLEMLSDPSLMHRCRTHLLALIAFVQQERESGDLALRPVLDFYSARLSANVAQLDDVDGDLISGFAALERQGVCELVTTGATHAFLPLQPTGMVRAQIRQGIDTFARLLGHRPLGMWMPECGVDARVLDVLHEEGVAYTVVDEHCLVNGTPGGECLQPAATPEGVVLLGRHPALSALIWSAEDGYPGDPRYREFHRDRGYDLPRSQILPHTQHPQERRAVGLKYHAITGKQVPLGEKRLYEPGVARQALSAHVEHFADRVEDVCSRYARWTGRGATCVLPFDAELFGHWWLEGVEFLDAVVRRLASTNVVAVRAPGKLTAIPTVMTPADGSWGYAGYGETWLNAGNDWILPLLHTAWQRYDRATFNAPAQDSARALALRELSLAAASDWPFMITTGVMADLAERRVREHLARFEAVMDVVNAMPAASAAGGG